MCQIACEYPNENLILFSFSDAWRFILLPFSTGTRIIFRKKCFLWKILVILLVLIGSILCKFVFFSYK